MEMTHDQFWNMTIAEFNECAEAHREREDSRIKELKASQWGMAYLYRVDVKKFPSFDKWIGQEKKTNRPMNDDEMLEAVKALHKAFGGEVH